MMKSEMLGAVFVLAAACGLEQPAAQTTDASQDHDPRFIGLWAVEHPTNAQFVATFYDFRSDGTLAVGGSTFEDCSWVSSEHCVVGLVGDCGPTQTCYDWSDSCVFGDEWYSLSPAHLTIVGDCSDGRARKILIGFNEDSSSNSEGGASATLLAVDNDTDWTFRPIGPIFRKCPDGMDESTCAAHLAPS
jgi:hypothetical protein